MKIKWRTIPANLLTTANLCSGLAGIALAFDGNLEWAGWAVAAAAVFDFLDGFAARLLHGQSAIGKELDSLADMVSFGVLPGVIIFQLINATFGEYYHAISERSLVHLAWSCVALVLPVAAAFRLAKFNIDTKQSGGFLGLPTPAAALMVASFPVIMSLQYNLNPTIVVSTEALGTLARQYFLDDFDVWMIGLLNNPWVYIWTAAGLALLEVSRLPMIAFKFKNLKWHANRARFIFLILCLLVIFTATIPYWTDFYVIPYVDYAMLLVILLLYIIYSLVLAGVNLARRKPAELNERS